MKLVRTYLDVAPSLKGAAAAIGNFDGVHKGHQAVISNARAAAGRLGAPLGILTFEPHPREFFAPDAAPFRLMSRETRAHRLEKLGVDILYELSFDAALSGLGAEAFAAEVLADGLGLRHVVVGQDFLFGKGRSGRAADLPGLGARHGFGATLSEMVDFDGLEVSSTRIRTALSEGRAQAAAEMLGHLHRVDGPVLHGQRRGRDLGFPTANMSIDGLHLPRFGVYAVEVDILSGPHAGTLKGVASVGVRPMFGENRPNIETFIFDFDGDLYGTHLSVGLVEWLRPEERFDSLDALVAQMQGDSQRARAILDAR